MQHQMLEMVARHKAQSNPTEAGRRTRNITTGDGDAKDTLGKDIPLSPNVTDL